MTNNLYVTPEPIRKTPIYALHSISQNQQELFGKCFDYFEIKKHNLVETIALNKQILKDEHSQILFNEFLLPVYESIPFKKGVMFVIPKFEHRLNQYIQKKGGLQQEQIKDIAKQLIKAVYGLLLRGYLLTNLRLEQFVFYQNRWMLESFNLTDEINFDSSKSEYSWRRDYQAPQCYSFQQKKIEVEQLKKMLVWDFGNMIVDMVVGHHLLKNQQIINSFKGKVFSFQSVKARIGETLSFQLRDFIGKMCHYNLEQRMSLSEFFSSGFFSQEIAEHYLKRIEQQAQEQEYEHEQEQEQEHEQEQEQQQQQYEKFFNQVQSQSQQALKRSDTSKKRSLKRKKSITNPQIDTAITQNTPQYFSIFSAQFWNLNEKSQIMISQFEKFQKAIKLCKNKDKEQQLVLLTKYSLQFFQCLELCSLLNILEQKTQIEFVSEEPQAGIACWEKFYQSEQFFHLHDQFQKRKEESFQELEEIREKCLAFLKFHPDLATKQIQLFLMENSPDSVQYQDIRVAYLTIIKQSYDLMAKHYPKNKTQEWASIGMFITFCMTIQVMYIPKNYHKNFRFYFKWLNQNGVEHVNKRKYIEYLQNADKQILVENAIFMIQKYYEVY